MRKRLAAGVLAACVVANLLLAGGPHAGTAHACSCAGAQTTEEAFRASDAVFSGEVVEVGELPSEPGGGTMTAMPYLAPVTFDVRSSWKGVSGASAVVHGQGPSASCGLDFERGETYLVFAGRPGTDGPLHTDFCGNTFPASEETARNILGPPKSLPETGGIPFGAVALGCASLVVGVALLGRAARGHRL